ncbi:phage portal protein [Ochrobactrum sp. WV_118_8]
MSFLANDPEMLELLDLDQATPPAQGDVLLPGAGGGKERAMVGGAYDAASRFDKEVALWTPSIRSADSDLLHDKPVIDARVRDTARNDAYAAAGSEIRKDNIVGSMFLLNSKPNARVLGLDEVWEEEYQEEVEAKFTLWAESQNNYVDASAINNFTAFIRLGVGISGLTGEILTTAEWIEDGRPFNTAMQMIDTDRLSTPPNLRGTDRVRGGVERNRYGQPLAYHIRKAHPTDFLNPDSYQWKRVAARKPWGRQQVIHIYEQFRPDQSRGVSRMVSALKETRITKRFRDVVLQNAVVNATYAASVESDLPTEAVYAMLGGGQLDAATVANAVRSFAGGYMETISEYMSNAKNLSIDGVKIPHLMPGTKLQLRPAGQGGPLGTEFEQSLLRYIAAMLGVSYEQLSKDYSRTNYSSARAAMNETHKTMQASKRMTADRLATSIFMLWLEEAFAKGEITSLPRRAPNFWEGLNREAYSACEWIGASRGQIDELKETQAAVLRLKYGLSTREDELARLGKDWRKVFAQLEREEALAKERGLVFMEDDNTMNATTGAPREKEAKDEKDDGSEDNTDA